MIGIAGAVAGFVSAGAGALLFWGIVGSVVGAVAGGAVNFTNLAYDPNAGLSAEADQLQAQIVDKFCSASIGLDQNYDQIVQDYGLLTANRSIVEGTQQLAPALDKMVEQMTRSQELWIWQSFGNKVNTSKNFWIGWCEVGVGNCWDPTTSPDVWVAPENPNIHYRLIGATPTATARPSPKTPPHSSGCCPRPGSASSRPARPTGQTSANRYRGLGTP